jgi:hypothetical protein
MKQKYIAPQLNQEDTEKPNRTVKIKSIESLVKIYPYIKTIIHLVLQVSFYNPTMNKQLYIRHSLYIS